MDTQQLENRIQKLENQIKTLEQWQKEKQSQQISFPLDQQSIEILNKYFMRIYQVVTATGGASGNTFTIFLGKQGNTDLIQRNIEFIVSQNDLIPFIVNVSENCLNVTKRYIENWQEVYFSTTGTLPTPLDNTLLNYTVESDGTNFKIATKQGGLISITNGSNAVVGNGTSFTSLNSGDVIYCGGISKIIDTITDDTHLTTTENWSETRTNDYYYLLNIITDSGVGLHYIETL